jgi:hypothetical protein
MFVTMMMVVVMMINGDAGLRCTAVRRSKREKKAWSYSLGDGPKRKAIGRST